MAINVICPGCMTRFQVSDKFAGKKGPCPKCGHIIEIPKENIVVHEPESVISGKKQLKGGNSLRPISRSTFVFTKNKVLLSIAGVLTIILAVFLLGFLSNGLLKNIIAIVGLLGISFPLAAFGYMMIRDDDDLEIFLGNELYRRSLWVAFGLSFAWIALEILMFSLNPGVYSIIYFIAAALLGSFIPFIVYETDYGKGLLIFILFAFCAIFLRGLMFSPNGWIWQQRPGMQMLAQPNGLNSSVSTNKNVDAPASENSLKTENSNLQSSSESAADNSDKKPQKPLSIQPPDPGQHLKRR